MRNGLLKLCLLAQAASPLLALADVPARGQTFSAPPAAAAPAYTDAQAVAATQAAGVAGNIMQGSYTLAAGPNQLPSAASYDGKQAMVTDLGGGANFLLSRGGSWRRIGQIGAIQSVALAGSGGFVIQPLINGTVIHATGALGGATVNWTISSSSTWAYNGAFQRVVRDAVAGDTGAFAVNGVAVPGGTFVDFHYDGAAGAWFANGQPSALVGPQGAAGAAGQSAYQAAVANGFSGTQAQWLASLQGAQGNSGANGNAGSAASVNVGAVSALPAGSTPVVSNSGSSSAAVFNFGIPAGNTGPTGATGPAGSNAPDIVQTVDGVGPTAFNIPLALTNLANVSGLTYLHRYANQTMTVPAVGLGGIGTGTVTVSGAAVGDMCLVAPTAAVATLGYQVGSGWVTTAGTVKVQLEAGTLLAISAGTLAVNMLCLQ